MSGCHRHSDTVVVIVMDTVRADHTSLCDYPRPTTPTLENLRDTHGAVISCRAYSDAPWTLPSHASLFTGLEPPEHGLHFPTLDTPRGDRLWALDPGQTTLAEQMGERGYQTMLVSGNPVLKWSTGLHRGFERTAVAKRFGQLYGDHLMARLHHELQAADPGRPLFLFVNIADAHQPWTDVPPGLDWVPPRRGLAFHARKPGDARRRYMRRVMKPQEAEKLVTRNVDVYDYGIHRADMTLLGVLAVIQQERGFPDRLVITSDHGEYVGTHERLGHGGSVYDDVTRVPFLVAGRGAKVLPDGPFAVRSIHDWVLTGDWPEEPVTAVAYPSPNWRRHFGAPWGTTLQVAVWSGTDKLWWTDGEVVRYDLAADPGELNPLPAEGHPALPALLDLAERAASAPEPAEDVGIQLEALGYVE